MALLIDEQVNAWLKERFLGSTRYEVNVHGTPDQIKVVVADVGWDCGCYSSRTRDDDFHLMAKMEGKGGYFHYRYGEWGSLPEFIEQLDEYINGNGCRYESDEHNAAN